MKNAILFCFAALSIFPSCRKTDYVNVTIHDTDTVTVIQPTAAPTLVGEWWDTNPLHTHLIFDVSTYHWQEYNMSFPYLISADTVYLFGSNHVVSSVYGYKLAKTNDTLWLYYKSATPRTDVMLRVGHHL
jgi:hypothetical protein